MQTKTTKIKDVDFLKFFDELKKLDSVSIESGGFYSIKVEGERTKYAFYIQYASGKPIQFCEFNAIGLYAEYDAERAYGVSHGKTTEGVEVVHQLYDLVMFRKQINDGLNQKETKEVKKTNKI